MSITEFSGLDLSIDVVRGMRSFEVDRLGRLTGVTYKDVWRPGENVATCHRKPYEDPYLSGVFGQIYRDMMGTYFQAPQPSRGWLTRRMPDPPMPVQFEQEPAPRPEPPHTMADCKCGFYGYYDGSDDYGGDSRISAVIEGYGETVIGTRGFRCSKARIVALCIPESFGPALARKVRRNYAGLPVFDTFAAMEREYPPDSSLEPGPDSDPDFWTRTA